MGNNDGIVLVNSKGKVCENNIKANQRSGILTADNTTTKLEGNMIEDN
jgi:nitrous oxidase accessory protein NosD